MLVNILMIFSLTGNALQPSFGENRAAATTATCYV